MIRIGFEGRRLAAALLLSLLFLAPLAMQASDKDEPFVLITPPSTSARATPTSQASSPLVNPTPNLPVTPTPPPSPTANPWECKTEVGEYAANAPREQKERAHSLGRPVDYWQPNRMLAQALHADLCGAPGHAANKSLALHLFNSVLMDGDPNFSASDETWRYEARYVAGLVDWDAIAALPPRHKDGTYYTVAAKPNPTGDYPELYMTYFPHDLLELVNVPLRLPDRQYSVLLRPQCGWQIVMEEQTYTQWPARTTMKLRIS